MADEHEQDDDLTEIIVNAREGGGGNGGGGGSGGGGFFGGFEFGGGWADSFIWSVLGGATGPDSNSVPPDDAPEIVVTAPPAPPMGNLTSMLDVITQLLTFDNLDDFIGIYRLRVTPGDSPRIELDMLEVGSNDVQTFVITQNGDLQFTTPLDEVTAYPDQPWNYSGPDQSPLPGTEFWNWA